MPHNSSPPAHEVVSVPAGGSYALVMRHGVYSCPTRFKPLEALYVAFRASGSTMDRLFPLWSAKRYVVTPVVDAIECRSDIPESDRLRILAYLKDPEAIGTLVELNPTHPEFQHEIAVYVFDREHVVWLPTVAKMEKPSVATAYYTLRELLDPSTAPFARVASQTDAE